MLGNLCGFMSNNAQPGTFAYEAFNTVPQLPLGGVSQFLANGGTLQQFASNFGNVCVHMINFHGNICQLGLDIFARRNICVSGTICSRICLNG